MKLFNTLTRKIEDVKPIDDRNIKMYICGPTVYNSPTLGNLRTYISEDLLRRALKYEGYKVEEVMNITDIEDKIIRDSAKEGIDPENMTKLKEFTKKYEDIFLENLGALNIEPVEYMPHATDEKMIARMIMIISELLKKGVAYKSDDGSIYFSICKFKDYGKLSGLEKRDVKAGARVAQDEYDKENAQDFALWKAAKAGEPSWDAPFGKGRPGWHIECTAMSTMILGDTIDIHGGGIDLIFPHHENEIAQSEAYTGKKFVNTWFHTGHLHINGQRMGKSLGNFYTLDDLSKFRATPTAYRFLCLQAHYRDTMNFTEESITAGQITYDNLRKDIAMLLLAIATKNTGKNIKGLYDILEETKIEFDLAVEEDLNIPKALAEVFKFLNIINAESGRNFSAKNAKEILNFLNNTDLIFGLGFDKISLELPADYLKLAKDREQARKVKDWAKSDEIRTKLEEADFIVEDTAMGQLIFK
jgi:cysteinyl-tRNA synthetase